jgi:hypothetical protein
LQSAGKEFRAVRVAEVPLLKCTVLPQAVDDKLEDEVRLSELPITVPVKVFAPENELLAAKIAPKPGKP